MFKTVKCRDGPARAAPSHLFFSLPSTRRKNVARGSKKSRATFWKTIGNGWKNYGQRFSKLRAMFFEITGNRIYADNQPYLSPQLGKNFFLTGKIITAGRDARSLRPDCAQVASRLHPGCVRATRAREHYIVLGIDKTGENCSMKWRNRAVEHSVEHNVPRTFVEQSEIVNALIHIVEHPLNIRGTLLNEMINEAKRGCFAHFVAR